MESREFTPRTAITIADRVQDFLQQEIEYSMDNQDVKAPEETKAYLTGLLAKYMPSDTLHAGTEGRATHQKLVELRAQALAAKGIDRCDRHIRLGDLALFMSSIFSDHVRNSRIGERYYTDMGQQAYDAAADIMATRLNRKEAPALYTDLADRFLVFKNVLEEVGDRVQIDRQRSLIRLAGRLNDSRRVRDVLVYRGATITRKTLLYTQ